jgi:Cytochrome c7 and related cytochrome c
VTADVHFRKAGMTCVDCHTAIGVMGDGKEYDKMEQQVDITCRACHSPSFRRITDSKSVAYLLSDANRRVPDCRGKNIGWTRKGTPIYNLQLRGGKPLFFRKLDGGSVKLDTASGKKPYHTLQGHGRLSCQSCHSSWMPQCYGCHIGYKSNEDQRDWLTGKVTKGRWMEGRSYIRFLKPALGLRNNSLVYPISPCQVFLPDSLPENGEDRDTPRRIFTISAFDPHTTSLKSRQCMDCHGDPKTLGLGEGILMRKKGKWEFRPIYDSIASHLGVSFPLDGLMSKGQKIADARRSNGTRPFTDSEIDRILSVDACIGCHSQYDDKIYRNFAASLRRFQKDNDLPCRK